MHDLMIIGGGPAGLAAGVYAARKRLKTLLISIDIGGQVNRTFRVENYLGYQFIEGPELIEKFHAQVSQFPIDQEIGYKVTRVEKIDGGFEAISETGGRYQAKAVIFAAGKSSRKLDVPGEAEFTGKGVSYCATCDGPIFAGQKVAVVGGGNSALEVALDMVKIAEYVYLVSLGALTGDTVLVDRLAGAKNLSVLTGHRVGRIEGQGLVKSIVLTDLKNGNEKRLEVGAVFIEVGLAPNSEPLSGLVKLNEFGEVPVNCSGETSLTGLYAAGDVTDVTEKQIVVAAGEGAKAALRAHRYLQRLL